MNSKNLGKLIGYLLLLGFSAYAIFLHLYNQEVLNGLCREDGLLEGLSAIFYFAAAGFFIFSNKKYGFKNPWFWFFAALFFVIAGEEISWGQRIFGIVTPENLESVNVQNEFNLHNVDGIHQNVRSVGVLFILVICYILPLSNWLIKGVNQIVEKLKISIYPLWLLGVPTLALLFMIIPRLLFDLVDFNLDEIGEVYLALGFLLFSISTLQTRETTSKLAAEANYD
jgi:hypothetical protein